MHHGVVLDFRGEFSGDRFSAAFPVLTAETHTEYLQKISAKNCFALLAIFFASFFAISSPPFPWSDFWEFPDLVIVINLVVCNSYAEALFCALFRRRTNVQQLTCKIDLSISFYYLFFSFVLLELKPFVLKGKAPGEKF